MLTVNQDIAVISHNKRIWNWQDIASIWTGIVICVSGYSLGAILVIQFGLNVIQSLSLLIICGLLAVALSFLTSEPGFKYGVGGAVILRSVFGHKGVVLPVIMRNLVCCGWLGIHCLFGGTAIHLILSTLSSRWAALGTLGEVYGYLLFLGLNILFFVHGYESVRKLARWSAPLLLAVGAVLLIWAMNRLDMPVFMAQIQQQPYAPWIRVMQAATVVCASWFSFTFFMSDFSRFCRTRRDYQLGQFLGLYFPKLLFGALGVILGTASYQILGQQTFDMVTLTGGMENPVWRITALLIILLATLTTTVAGCLAIPAFDLLTVMPNHLHNLKVSSYLVAVVGTCVALPELLRRSGLIDNGDFAQLFTDFLKTYSSIINALIVLSVIHYYGVLKQKLSIASLYGQDSSYPHFSMPACTVFAILVLLIMASTQVEAFRPFHQYGSLVNGFISAPMYLILLWMAKHQQFPLNI